MILTPAQKGSLLHPRMSECELMEFNDQLGKFSWFLEFGCGGSTITALNSHSATIFSVESDRDWIEKVAKLAGADAGRVHFHHADIGKTGVWGHPVHPATPEIAARYHQDIWYKIDTRIPGLCLVDGRFRVACCMQAILRMPSGSIILFHDFANRNHFRKATAVLEIEKIVDTMAVIAIRDRHRTPECLELLASNFTNPK